MTASLLNAPQNGKKSVEDFACTCQRTYTLLEKQFQ